MKLKQVALLIILLMVTFVTSIILSSKFNSKKELSFSESLNTYVTLRNKNNYKGIVIINDTLAIYGNTPRINIDSSLYIVRYKNFGSLDAPYKIMKKHNNDTIIVIKDYETLYYKLNY